MLLRRALMPVENGVQADFPMVGQKSDGAMW